MKAQITIEYIVLAIALIAISLVAIAFFFGLFSAASNNVSSTSIYGIESLYFYPLAGQGIGATNYIGEMEINLYTTSPTNFNNVYLIQTVNNSIATNCPSYVKFSGFPSNGLMCISLGVANQTLNEGNNQYLITFSNVAYNGTAFTEMNVSNSQYAKYIVFNQNGKYLYEQLTQEPVINIQ